MDKDDKKKMGEEKYNQFHKIKKILRLKNSESRNMAKMIEDALDGKTPESANKKPEQKKDDADSSQKE